MSQGGGFWVTALAGAMVGVVLVRLLLRSLGSRLGSGPRLAPVLSDPGSLSSRREGPIRRRPPASAPPRKVRRRWPFA